MLYLTLRFVKPLMLPGRVANVEGLRRIQIDNINICHHHDHHVRPGRSVVSSVRRLRVKLHSLLRRPPHQIILDVIDPYLSRAAVQVFQYRISTRVYFLWERMGTACSHLFCSWEGRSLTPLWSERIFSFHFSVPITECVYEM